MKLSSTDLIQKNFRVKTCQESADQFTQHEDNDEERPNYISWRSGECTIVTDGIEIAFGWDASANKAKSYNDAFAFSLSLGEDTYWEIKGATLVDEDGDELSESEVNAALREVIKETDWKDHVKALLPVPDETEVEKDLVMTTNDENVSIDDMKEWTVERDDGPNLKFTGYVLGNVSSSANNASSNYSGSVGRWRELTLYKTAGGKFICEDIGHTQWQGEHDRKRAAVCTTPEEVQKFFGHGWLAKDLYAEAELDACQHID